MPDEAGRSPCSGLKTSGGTGILARLFAPAWKLFSRFWIIGCWRFMLVTTCGGFDVPKLSEVLWGRVVLNGFLAVWGGDRIQAQRIP